MMTLKSQTILNFSLKRPQYQYWNIRVTSEPQSNTILEPDNASWNIVDAISAFATTIVFDDRECKSW